MSIFTFLLDKFLIYQALFLVIQQHKKIACTNIKEGCILISITILLCIFILTFMSHEFKAPEIIATESITKPCNVKLRETLSLYQDKAKKRYGQALSIAENIDDRIQTSVPFNRNALSAASLLMLACVRGAEIS